MACLRNFSCVLGLLVIVTSVCDARVLSPSGFVQVRGTRFVLNGSPFLFNGFNSYWMMHVAVEPSDRTKVSSVFREASAAGLTVCRTWAFSDGGDRALQVSPGVYDERVFEVSTAGRHGIRLILSLSNNYHDFGGRPQYIQWARKAGVPINNVDDFYTNAVIKGYYKNHVKRVLTRLNSITRVAYRDDPTIMAWELINEPRCQVDYSGNTVNEWAQEMAPYVKSIDNKHLLGIGMEGFYGNFMPSRKQYNPGYQVGTDYIKNNLIREIDFATIHAYPDIWLSGEDENAQTVFVDRWMESHLADAKTIIRKPLVFTEFGKSKNDPDYSPSVRDSYMNTVYSDIYNLARNGGAFGGGLVWQVLAEGMDSYKDGYGIVLSEDGSTRAVISQQSNKMASLEHALSAHHG
ncbi:hypothetical protein BT93_J1141 [Corymbia citriodora subsp. variegata]|nr:hypothetical protein BT93_J1141 [Corymbia citriodora subsp. variegata]